MRTSEEVLAFVNEQLWYTEIQARDKGLQLPLLAKLEINPSQQSLEVKHKLYNTLKMFIQGEI